MSSSPTLLRALGTRRLAVSIFNTVVGAGIFVLPATVAGLAGPAAPFAYLACSVAMLFVALSFASAGSRVPAAGGAYPFVAAGLGPWAGSVTGVLQWLSDTLASASVAAAFAAAIGLYLPGAGSGAGRVVLLSAVCGGLAALNIRGIRQSARFLDAITVAKLTPLLLFVAVGLGAAVAHAAPPALPTADVLGRTTLVLLFAFAGVESALALSGEVRDPGRAIPRAVLAALGGISVLYILVHSVASAALGADLVNASAAPLSAAGERLGGSALRQTMLAATTISMFGYLSALATATPRLLYSMGAGGLLPEPLSRVHDVFRTPWVAILVQATLVVAIASTGSFSVLAPMASVAILSVYLMVCAAVIPLQGRSGDGAGTFTVPRGIPLAGLAVILWMLANATPRELLIEGAVILAASLLYLVRRGRVDCGTAAVSPL
jgi:basic amino acid/polyamine antiporter, APA family